MKWTHQDTGKLTWQSFLIIVMTVFAFMSLIPLFMYGRPYVAKQIDKYKTVNSNVVQSSFLYGKPVDYISGMTDDMTSDIFLLRSLYQTPSSMPIYVSNIKVSVSNKKVDGVTSNAPGMITHVINGHGSNKWYEGDIKLGNSQWSGKAHFVIKNDDVIFIDVPDGFNMFTFIIKGMDSLFKNTNQFIYSKRLSDDNYDRKTIYPNGTSIVTIEQPHTELTKKLQLTNSERERAFDKNVLKYVDDDHIPIVIHDDNTNIKSNSEFEDTDNLHNYIVSVVKEKYSIDIYSRKVK